MKQAITMNSRRFILGFAFLIIFLFMFLLMDLRLGTYDEGIILTGAANVSAGAIPHRDFYANYGPGQFYIVALLFEIFGPSFLIARVPDIASRAFIVVLTYLIVRRWCHHPVAYACSAATMLWLVAARTYGYPVIPALALSLLGTHLLLSRHAFPSHGSLFLAGALTGTVALFRYDIGFFVLVAHCAGLIAATLLSEANQEKPLRALMSRIAVYGAGTTILFAPVAALLLIAGALPGFLHDIIDYPLHYYAAMRSLPFPDLRTLTSGASGMAKGIVYLPAAAVALAALWAGHRKFRRSAQGSISPSEGRFLLFFGILVTVLILKGAVRVSPLHMLLAVVPSFILLAFLTERQLSPKLAEPLAWAGGAAVLMATTAFWWLGLGNSLAGNAVEMAAGESVPAPPQLTKMAGGRLDPDMACALSFIAAVTDPNEKIFVGTMRHDKLFVNRVEAYFASGRSPATHWYHFDPGLQTRADIQNAIIADLGHNNVKWLVRDASFDDVQEPNVSSKSSGVFLLDQYIKDRYRPVEHYGPISIWLAKDSSPPPRHFFSCEN